jgi:tripartite-type tricarboxylate transporter receptor subunit TctC
MAVRPPRPAGHHRQQTGREQQRGDRVCRACVAERLHAALGRDQQLHQCDAVQKKLPYNFIRDIEPVASNTRTPLVMEVNPSVPVKTVPEFIAYAKAHPGKLNMASGGIGNSTHMAGELFKMMTGVNLLHVPYRGSAPAINDLLGGQVQVMFDLMASSIGHIRAGKLRALGVTTATRSAALPDVPTIGEFVPGYEASAVGGIGLPKGTAAAIVDKLNAEINAALADPKMKSRFADLGVSPVPGSPADFGKLIAAETDK